MAADISIVKGKVCVTGQLTEAQIPDLVRRCATRSRLELRRTRHKTFDFLEQLPDLEELELVRTRVSDAGALARLSALRVLWLNGVTVESGFDFLTGLPQVRELHLLNHRGSLELPDLAGMTSLRTFREWGCKGLTDLSVLLGVQRLEEVVLTDAKVEPEDFTPVLAMPSVRYVSAQFGSKQRNDRFVEIVTAHGKAQYRDAIPSGDTEL